MSNRFYGRFSPGAPRPDPRRKGLPKPRHPHEGRPKWITVAASPFLLTAFFQSPEGMVASLAGFGLVAAGMWMTREGLVAEAEYDARRVARRPAIPRKLFGGIAAALGLGVGAFEPGAAAEAGLIGAAGLALHWLAFGPDPMRDKGMEGVDSFQQDRANRMIEDGQAHLDQMADAIRRAGDRHLEARVAAFAATVQDLFEQVRQDPGDLSSVRRYMGVYLKGARDATVKFANLYARTGDSQTRAAYEAFLNDLEKDFIARREKLLDSNRTDLDIEISVLRERLEREGVRPAPEAPDPASPNRPALQSQRAQTLDTLLGEYSASNRKRD